MQIDTGGYEGIVENIKSCVQGMKSLKFYKYVNL